MDLASDFVDSDDDGTQTDSKMSKILKFPIKEQSFLQNATDLGSSKGGLSVFDVQSQGGNTGGSGKGMLQHLR